MSVRQGIQPPISNSESILGLIYEICGPSCQLLLQSNSTRFCQSSNLNLADLIRFWHQCWTEGLPIVGLSSVIRTRQWGVRHQGIEHCVWICLTPIPKKQCQLVLTKNALDGGCAGHQQARLFPLLCNNCNWLAVPAARFNNPSGFIA